MAHESILIIDDSPLNLKLARVLLQSEGYVIRTASEGNEALSILTTFKPQLVLMDIQLPGIDGLEVTRRIKANPDTQGIVVVALTASAMKGDEQKVLNAGCDGYITKPFESKKLLLSIREYLDGAIGRSNSLLDGCALSGLHSQPLMPATKCILVVEDDPIEKKILCITLEAVGFRTITASDGAEAIETARLAPPDLIVSDIFMPTVDGFTLCRAARNDVSLASVPIMLRTAGHIQKSDEVMARSMGASALVSKDQDMKALLASVNAALTEDVPMREADLDRNVAGITQEFLIDGERQSRHLRDDLKTGIDIPAARELMHRWAGTGGTLGFPKISQTAFAIDSLLELSPSNIEILETRFEELPKLFSDALKDSHKVKPVPAEIIEVLSGSNIALAGFEASEASRTQVLLQRAGATCEDFERSADITILKVSGEVDISPYAATAILIITGGGQQEPVIEAQLERQSHPHDFLLEPYSDEEILVRCCQLILRSGISESALPLPRVTRATIPRADPQPGRARVLIADDDPTVTALVSHTLSGFNMEYLATSDGGDVVRLAAEFKPDVIVLDVNMPNVGGFEALASLKSDARTKQIPVVLLTSRQQEADIMKGFGLGADDYIVKPFSPMELVARIKRLIHASSS
jgi:CheY-like chemotaxis protein